MMVPRAKAGVFVSLKDQMIEVWWTEPPPGSIHNSQELDTTDPNSLDILAGIVNKVKVLYEQ